MWKEAAMGLQVLGSAMSCLAREPSKEWRSKHSSLGYAHKPQAQTVNTILDFYLEVLLKVPPLLQNPPLTLTRPAAVLLGVHVSPGLAPCNLSLGHDATVSPPRSSAHPKNSRCNRLPRSARRLPDN